MAAPASNSKSYHVVCAAVLKWLPERSLRAVEHNKTTKEGLTMGRIYQRGNMLWIQYYRAGKYYRESAHSDKETDAKKLLKIQRRRHCTGPIYRAQR